MDRRNFLAVGSLASVSSLVVPFGIAQGASRASHETLFRGVDFTTDGLGLKPAEYVELLTKAVDAGAITADNYSRGGLVEQLEQEFSRRLGKPAAMFVPTGTLANHLAVRKLAGTDPRVIVQAESHLYNDSGDAAQVLSGLNLIPLAVGETSFILEQVEEWVARSKSGRVEAKVGVISIESPVRRRDHAMVPFEEMQRISSYAREQGIRLHLDGSRMFNLPFHSGKSLKEYSALFDTVYVSLWKHFNGASGAILAGEGDFIEGLYHARRMFGSALPTAWPLLATVMQFLPTYEADYARAWANAEQVFALLQTDGRIRVRKLPDGTCRVFLTVPSRDLNAYASRVSAHGVTLPHAREGSTEIPIQVNPTLLRMTPGALARVLLEALD